jgi:pSer/pThr/pTyr-binding forkhead associated (FHA) protein
MATLQIIGQEALLPLNQSQIGIGRAPDNEMAIEDDAVSVYHALITIRPSSSDEKVMEYIIEDLNSTNNTFVNNKEITNYKLKNGDIIRVGNTRIKFSTKKYVPPQQDFTKTKKLSKIKVSSFLSTK